MVAGHAVAVGVPAAVSRVPAASGQGGVDPQPKARAIRQPEATRVATTGSKGKQFILPLTNSIGPRLRAKLGSA